MYIVLHSLRQALGITLVFFSIQILFCSSNEECVRCTVGGSSLAGVSDESICSTCNVEKYDIVRINRNNLGEQFRVL